MVAEKKKETKHELRVPSVEKKLYDKILKLSKQERRSMARQIEHMLIKYCEEHNL